MEKILSKFNELTENEFDYLKLSSVNVNVRKCTCDFNLIYPAAKERHVSDRREYIENTLRKLIRSSAEVNIKLKKSHFDFDFFKADFFAFLSAYPTLANTLADKDVQDVRDGDKHTLRLILTQSVYDYCLTQNLGTAINDFLSANFCEDISVEFVASECEVTVEAKEASSASSEFVFERPEEGRMIRPQNVEEFIGRIIYEPAGYIEDASTPKESTVLCGTITKIFENSYTSKKGEEKKLYKFIIEDGTGSMSCVYYPNKNTEEQIKLLIQGKQIVARGNTELYKEFLSFKIKDICLCTLPKAFRPNRMRRRVPDEYKVIFPEKYVEKKQSSLFDALTESKPIPKFMKGKTFCVFDIETTGFNPDLNKIIEIGAVKAVDGKVTETFSTFIDPCEPLPERIIKLTHIEDSDVQGKPHIEEVLPDFYKFVSGTILVGQNVQFDHGFIAANGAPLKIYFENQLMDTLSLARTYFPGLRNYKLETLVKHFGVVNKGAHRAIYDAWATFEVFMKIAEKLN